MSAQEPETAENLLALPFDQYQRYRLIEEVVRRVCPLPAPLILDVGGWPGTLRRFLPDARVVIADMQGRDPRMVRATGTRLPFRDRQFDVVVSSDTFEHVPPPERAPFLAELLRVARDTIVLGAPFDSPEVRAAEAVLREGIRDKFPDSYRFIDEHEAYGLPDLSSTLATLRSAGWATAALPNGYLHHWLPMLSLYFALQWRSPHEPLFARLNEYYNAAHYRSDNRAPSYRTTIVASRAGTVDLAALRAELCPAPDPGASDAPPWPALAALLAAIDLEARVAPRDPLRRIVELEQLVEERTDWALSLQRRVAAQQATIRDLTAILAARHPLARGALALRALLARWRRRQEASPR